MRSRHGTSPCSGRTGSKEPWAGSPSPPGFSTGRSSSPPQEKLECLAERWGRALEAKAPEADGTPKELVLAHLVPIVYWVAYPLLVISWLVLLCLLAAKCVYPIRIFPRTRHLARHLAKAGGYTSEVKALHRWKCCPTPAAASQNQQFLEIQSTWLELTRRTISWTSPKLSCSGPHGILSSGTAREW